MLGDEVEQPLLVRRHGLSHRDEELVEGPELSEPRLKPRAEVADPGLGPLRGRADPRLRIGREWLSDPGLGRRVGDGPADDRLRVTA